MASNADLGTKEPTSVLVVGELLQSRRILHPATPEITIGRLGALYEAVAKARSDLSRSVSDRADGALETLHVDTLVKCALGTTGNPDMSAIFSSLLAIPEFVPCGSVSLSCAIRTSKVTDSAVIEEFCRLVTSLPEKYLRHTSKAPLRTVPDVDDLADHGDWVGGQHAHARIAVDLAGRRLHQLAQRWQFMRIDGTGTLSTAKTLTGLGDVRAVGRTWSRWFASLGHHPEVLSRQASVVMSIPDDAILLVPADAVHSLARELRADFERCFPPCRLRWAAAELNERSTPFSVAECYSSQLRAARRAAVSG